MSEQTTKVKVNILEKSYELEGSENFVREMTVTIQELLEKTPVVKSTKNTKSETKTDVKPSDKKTKRGGQRSSVISPALDKMIDEGWFSDFKTIAETIIELKRLSVPGVNSVNVGMALSRRVPEKLDRIKTSDGKWTYKKK